MRQKKKIFTFLWNVKKVIFYNLCTHFANYKNILIQKKRIKMGVEEVEIANYTMG